MNWFKSFWKALTTPMPRESHDHFEAMNNFTPRAQQVLTLARREAGRFNHNFVGTEHVLLGLIALGHGTAVNVLGKMGLDLENVRMEVERQVGTGPDQKPVGNIPYTPRVKKVLALAAKEAKSLNHTYVGTEHILLGVLSEGDGVAAPASAGTPQSVKPSEPLPESVDTSKRYDVYYSEGNQMMVYRNVLFKSSKKLLSRGEYGVFYQFLEIEQADGKVVFIARTSLIKFCEHGITPGPEKV
jgi:ATP-dependent Clp protease ATP-binding subunit ClpA